MLDRQVLVAQFGAGVVGGRHDRLQVAGQSGLGPAVGLGELRHGLVGRVAGTADVDADLVEDGQRDPAVGLAEEGGQQVVGRDLGVAEGLRLFDRRGEGLLGLERPLVRVQRHGNHSIALRKLDNQ